MLARWQFWIATVVALMAAVVAGYDMMLFGQNRTTQAELARRNQYIQQSVQLEPLYREMVKALADLSVRNQDKALSDLLGTQGITINAPAAATPPSPAPETKKGARP